MKYNQVNFPYNLKNKFIKASILKMLLSQWFDLKAKEIKQLKLL